MRYETALKAAGAKVLKFENFGDYQGNWFALLEGGMVVQGSYGSCSGCDAYEGRFDYSEPSHEQLAEFGREYLNEAVPLDQVIVAYTNKIKAAGEYAWDDDKKILEALKQWKEESK